MIHHSSQVLSRKPQSLSKKNSKPILAPLTINFSEKRLLQEKIKPKITRTLSEGAYPKRENTKLVKNSGAKKDYLIVRR